MRRLRSLMPRWLGVMTMGWLAGIAFGAGLFTSAAIGSVTEFTLPTGVYLGGGIAGGPDGALWFTARKGDTGQIGRLTTSGSLSWFDGLTGPAGDITSGPDGRLWFTEPNANKIGAITTDGVATEYSTGLTPRAGPSHITAGPDGRLWFTEYAAGMIGAITTAGAITEYPLANSDSEPYEITAGPYDQLWFTEQRGQAIGRITTGGTITERLANQQYPHYAPLGAIARVGSTLWVANNYSDEIGRFDITDHLPFVEWFGPVLNSDGIRDITAGPDRAVWFTDARIVGRMTVGGLITNAIRPPSATSAPVDIVSGPDGALWLTASDNPSRVIRITADVPPAPTLELQLAVTPPSDSGRFDLLIDSRVKKAAAGNGDTTGKQPVSVMWHRVRMTAVGETSLGDYLIAMACKDQGGSGETVADATFNAFEGNGWVPVASGSDIVCTITNKRRYPPSDLSVSHSGGIVQASWTLPPPPPTMLSGFLEFSPSPYLDPVDGSFSHGLTKSYLFASDETTFASGPDEFRPGTYYVHVGAHDPDECVIHVYCKQFWSPTVTLVVPAREPEPVDPTPPSPSAALSIATPVPPAPPPAPDKVVALGTVTATSAQDVDRLGITVTPGEAVTAKLSATVSVPGGARVYRFKTVARSIAAGAKTKLSLKLSGKAKKAVKRALRRGKRLRAKLSLLTTDSAGNAKTSKLSVRLRP